jgi:hypothetical protein
MTRVSDIAINECVIEMRAACRKPIDQSALETVIGWVRPEFERILDRPEGKARWAEFGTRVRETGRYVGTLADFFASHGEVSIVGIDELSNAMKLTRADCTVRAERTPVAVQLCPPSARLDIRSAEVFLRSVAPARELVSLTS